MESQGYRRVGKKSKENLPSYSSQVFLLVEFLDSKKISVTTISSIKTPKLPSDPLQLSNTLQKYMAEAESSLIIRY